MEFVRRELVSKRVERRTGRRKTTVRHAVRIGPHPSLSTSAAPSRGQAGSPPGPGPPRGPPPLGRAASRPPALARPALGPVELPPLAGHARRAPALLAAAHGAEECPYVPGVPVEDWALDD